MLSERDIKQAVLDKLLSKPIPRDAVVISEMVIGKSDRRADLVIANGHLHAIEIKSDLDSLRRLEGQMAVYLARFDKLTLVVASKFLSHALTHSPERVAVWEATTSPSGAVRLTTRRAGKIEAVTNKRLLCDFLLKNELVELTKPFGASRGNERSREELVAILDGLPLAVIRRNVLANVKTRYRETFHRASRGTTSDGTSVDDLSRVALKRQNAASAASQYVREPHYERRELNLLRFFPDGDIPEGMPTHVLVPHN